jgi:molybdate transport system permease protein
MKKNYRNCSNSKFNALVSDLKKILAMPETSVITYVTATAPSLWQFILSLSDPLWLTLRVAVLATALVMLIACVLVLPLEYWLAKHSKHSNSSRSVLRRSLRRSLRRFFRYFFRRFFRTVVRFVLTLFTLPLVLPPTVLGFYYVTMFGRENGFGRWIQDVIGVELVFSFWGLVLASVVYSLPFMLQPLNAGLHAIFGAQRDLLEAARTMGASRTQVLMRVVAPLSWRFVLAGCTLTFAHVVGEFGVVMMIGGNIAGETRTASVALYDAVQAMDYETAHGYALILLAVCGALLLAANTLQARQD